MHTRSVQGNAAAPLALAAALLLAGCSAGVEAGTLDPQRLSGNDADVGLVKIRNALLVAPAEEGDSVELVTTVVNDGTTDDSLSRVELAGPDGPLEIQLEPRTVDLPAETATTFGADGATMTLEDSPLDAGSYVSVTFYFETAGSHSMDVLVLSSSAVYGGAETEAPTPS